MSNEVGEAIQLIYLTSQMLAVGSSLVLKTPGKIVQGGKVVAEKTSWMQLQFKLLCNFKSKGSYETLSLKDMDRITGGDYRLVRIPIEKGMDGFEEEAIRFFDALKTLKIPFSEMPDINIGDGYIEIAINPQDSAKLKNLMEEYNFPTGSAENISMEEYLGNAKKESFQAFQDQAVNQAKAFLETQKKTDDGRSAMTADKDVQIISTEQFAQYFPKQDGQVKAAVVSHQKEEKDQKPTTTFRITSENMAHVWNDRLYLTFPGFPKGDTVCIDQTEVEMEGRDFLVTFHPDRKYPMRKLDESGHVRPEKSYKTGTEVCAIIQKPVNIQKKTKAVTR